MIAALTQLQRDAAVLSGWALFLAGLVISVRGARRVLRQEVATSPARRGHAGVAGSVPAAGDPRPVRSVISAEVEEGVTVVRRRPFDWQRDDQAVAR